MCISLLVVISLFGMSAMYLYIVYTLPLVEFAFIIYFFHTHGLYFCTFCLLFLVLNDIDFLNNVKETAKELTKENKSHLLFKGNRSTRNLTQYFLYYGRYLTNNTVKFPCIVLKLSEYTRNFTYLYKTSSKPR